MKRLLVILLKLIVVGGLLLYVGKVMFQNPDYDLKEELLALRSGWGLILPAQVFIFLLLFMSFYRWKLLLLAQKIHYTTREAVAIGFIGFFFSQFVPGSTGGDLMKAYYVAIDHPRKRAAGITTVFLDRVVGLLDLVALAGIAILLNWSKIMSDSVLTSLAMAVGVILVGALAGAVLFFSERVRSSSVVLALLRRLPFKNLLFKIQEAVYVYKYHPGLILSAVLISALVQLTMIAMAFCYSRALGGGPELYCFFFIVPLANLAMAVPLGSPGGLGQLEFAYDQLFRLFGGEPGFGLSVALIQRLNWYLWGVVGGVYYLKRRGKVRRARELARQSENGEIPNDGKSEDGESSGEEESEPELLQAGQPSPSRPAEG